MDWLQVKSVEELKQLGKFNDVRASMKGFGGKWVHLSGRSWNELFASIEGFKEIIQSVNDVDTSNYFTCKSNEYIFYLLELDGEIRMNKLGITPAHFSNHAKAKLWRDQLSKLIHPDICHHPEAGEAMATLNELYRQMTGRE